LKLVAEIITRYSIIVLWLFSPLFYSVDVLFAWT